MRRLTYWSTLAVFVLGFSSLVQAETLNMPPQSQEQDQPTEQAPASLSIDLPGRGMSMTEVEERFGAPISKVDEVGDPPITRWIYNDFTVFFEYQYVIHAMVTRQEP